MRAGELRYRIAIQRPIASTGPHGGKVKDWTDFAIVWAAIEPLSGREFFEAHQTETEVTTRIRIRAIEGLTTHMRIRYETRYYKINSIIESDGQLVIMAAETEDFT